MIEDDDEEEIPNNMFMRSHTKHITSETIKDAPLPEPIQN